MSARPVPSEAPPPAPEANEHRVGSGVLLALLSSSSTQTGAAVGATAFPAIGPVGVVAVRQLIMTTVLALVGKPRLRTITRRQWPLVLGLGLVFVVMNITIYLAIERIGLGLAITLEFLGPLAVAVATSRRLLDLLGALLAAVGVVVLVNPGPSTDLLGISLALVAAAAWGWYVLLNRRIGAELPGVQGTAAASIVSLAVWLPVGVVWFIAHPPPLWAIGAAVLCGMLSSVVPYTADLVALRRISPTLFGTLASLHPVWAALAGIVILRQLLTPQEWLGIALVVVSNIAVTVASMRRTRPKLTA